MKIVDLHLVTENFQRSKWMLQDSNKKKQEYKERKTLKNKKDFNRFKKNIEKLD